LAYSFGLFIQEPLLTLIHRKNDAKREIEALLFSLR